MAGFQLFNTEEDSDVGFSFVLIIGLEMWFKFKRTWLLNSDVKSFHSFKYYAIFKRHNYALWGLAEGIMVKLLAERKYRRSKQWTVLIRTRTTLCQTSVFWLPGKALSMCWGVRPQVGECDSQWLVIIGIKLKCFAKWSSVFYCQGGGAGEKSGGGQHPSVEGGGRFNKNIGQICKSMRKASKCAYCALPKV